MQLGNPSEPPPNQEMDARALAESFRRAAPRPTAIIGGLIALLAAVGWTLGGVVGVVVTLSLSATIILLMRLISAGVIARAIFGRFVTSLDTTALGASSARLAERAGVTLRVRLHAFHSRAPLAATVADGKEAVILLSTGLLRNLSQVELSAVLAHEISHLRHKDVQWMQLAGTLGNMILALARITLLLGLVDVIFGGRIGLSTTQLLLLTIAPFAAILLVLSLSRTREFGADAEATRLMGTTVPLASALRTIDVLDRRFWKRVVPPLLRKRFPWWLRTHPTTEERLQRLQEPTA